MDAKVFVIIVTYNGSKWIRKCLNAVFASSYPVQVVVVDNCSTDDTTEVIKSDYSKVILLEQKENLGFGKANNAGLRFALEDGAEYFLLLNQDAYVEDIMVQKLIDVFNADSRQVGIVSPVHLSSNGNLDYGFEDHIRRYASSESYNAIKERQEGIYETEFVNAACWLLNRKTIDIVGGFNPLFPHYGEDNDYINRLHFFGLNVLVEGTAKVIHDRSQFENLQYGKLMKREQVSFLKHASNITLSGSQATIKILDKWVRESVFYIITFQFKKCLAVNAGWFNLLLSINYVKRHRTLSKNKGAYL